MGHCTELNQPKNSVCPRRARQAFRQTGSRVEDSLGCILGTDEGDDSAAFSGKLPEQFVNRRQRQLPLHIPYGLGSRRLPPLGQSRYGKRLHVLGRFGLVVPVRPLPGMLPENPVMGRLRDA